MFPDKLLLLLLPAFIFACTEQMRQFIRIFFAIHVPASAPGLGCGAVSQRKTGQNLDLLQSDCYICAVVVRIDVSPLHFDLN